MRARGWLALGALLGRAGGRDIGRAILSGVILGVLFRSGATLVTRLLAPNANAVVQSVSFANVSRLSVETTLWAAGLTGPTIVLVTLGIVAVLTASATAPVGPVPFFRLIVAGLAHSLAPGARHRNLLLLAAGLAAVGLIGGHWTFERWLGLKATLSLVIEFAGGVLFLTLLIRGRSDDRDFRAEPCDPPHADPRAEHARAACGADHRTDRAEWRGKVHALGRAGAARASGDGGGAGHAQADPG